MSFKQKRAWKRINGDKLRKNLLLFVVSSSLINIEQMNVFVNFIQSSIQTIIDAIVSWTKFVSKSKSQWNQKCVDVVLTTRRKRRVWFMMRTEQTWHEYFKTTNKKKNHRTKKKNRVSSSISIFHQHVVWILTFNRLSEKQKSQVEKSF